jgi:hypothetical protein
MIRLDSHYITFPINFVKKKQMTALSPEAESETRTIIKNEDFPQEEVFLLTAFFNWGTLKIGPGGGKSYFFKELTLSPESNPE